MKFIKIPIIRKGINLSPLFRPPRGRQRQTTCLKFPGEIRKTNLLIQVDSKPQSIPRSVLVCGWMSVAEMSLTTYLEISPQQSNILVGVGRTGTASAGLCLCLGYTGRGVQRRRRRRGQPQIHTHSPSGRIIPQNFTNQMAAKGTNTMDAEGKENPLTYFRAIPPQC